jgi:hypothetical protein
MARQRRLNRSPASEYPCVGQIASFYQKLCQALQAKIFIFRFSEIYGSLCAVPFSQEGRFAIVTNVGAGCDGRKGGIQADGQAVWSWRPDAGVKPCEDVLQGDGG